MMLSVLCTSCAADTKDTEIEVKEYKITNINIFKETPVWELAQAVDENDASAIEKILKTEADIVDFQDEKYGATVLLWSIGMDKYASAEALLKCGADPNISSETMWKTPLYLASGFLWVSNVSDNDPNWLSLVSEYNADPKYIDLLLQYNADPNSNPYIELENYHYESRDSPLMHSVGHGIEKTRALVEGGADINYMTKFGDTAAITSIYKKNPEYAYYLIVDQKADITQPFFREKSYGSEDPNEKLYCVNKLRKWIFDLESDDYRMKMEIVEEFQRQGVDYWSTEIPENKLNKIKHMYPFFWMEFIKKY